MPRALANLLVFQVVGEVARLALPLLTSIVVPLIASWAGMLG